jgi:hypothetical protein
MMKTEDPIDIVYLWVDGSDPAWRTKRRNSLLELNQFDLNDLARYSNVEGRFRDNDELRYSLRALEQYFGQVPKWLRFSERISIIDHLDLIPQDKLPTYDSGNIESYIHRIPGLTERYIYFNDDVFFGAPVNVNDWFWDGGIYVAWSDEPYVSDEPMRTDATALENACRLSNQWFNSTGGSDHSQSLKIPPVNDHYVHTFRTFAHSPRPMLKSVLFELERMAPDLFSKVRSTVFRVWNKPTIVSDFVMRWTLATGQAQVRDHSHLYISTGTDASAAQLDLLSSMLGRIEFFCINDTSDDTESEDPHFEIVRNAMEKMFPIASGFEKLSPYQG